MPAEQPAPDAMPGITDWAVAHNPGATPNWRSAFWPQVVFVRDRLGSLLADRADHSYEDFRGMVRVCGTHFSNSVELPVYRIEWKRGVTFTLRYNFYDWGVEVDAVKPVTWDFDGLAKRDSVDSYCEGFPGDAKSGCWNDSPRVFTVGLGTEHDVYTFLFLLKRQFPALPEEVISHA